MSLYYSGKFWFLCGEHAFVTNGMMQTHTVARALNSCVVRSPELSRGLRGAASKWGQQSRALGLARQICNDSIVRHRPGQSGDCLVPFARVPGPSSWARCFTAHPCTWPWSVAQAAWHTAASGTVLLNGRRSCKRKRACAPSSAHSLGTCLHWRIHTINRFHACLTSLLRFLSPPAA
jgi:hypothetical protein